MNDGLFFDSGDPTVLDPFYIDQIGKYHGELDGVQVEQLTENHRLFLEGEFGKFRIYCLVTHTRPEIVPESVSLLSDTHFSAVLRLELRPDIITDIKLCFVLRYFRFVLYVQLLMVISQILLTLRAILVLALRDSYVTSRF